MAQRTPTRRFAAPIAVAAIVALSVALLGALASPVDTGWYAALNKPAWQPPDWLFGPAWTLIYALAAIAAVSAWWGATNPAARVRVVGLFGVNAVLNILWSVLFFTLQQPTWALAEVALLWLSIVALILGLWSCSRAASVLLVPYLLWVTFAAVLNGEIVHLNPGV